MRGVFHSPLPLPFPSPPFRILPLLLEVGSSNPARRSGGASTTGGAVSFSIRVLTVPQPKSNLMHFRLKLWQLVTTIWMIFLRINWSNFVQFTLKVIYALVTSHEERTKVTPFYWHTPSDDEGSDNNYNIHYLTLNKIRNQLFLQQ